MSQKIAAIVLAAGAGTRMRSPFPKVCHLIDGQPMIRFPVSVCQKLSVSPLIVVVSGKSAMARAVREALAPLPAQNKITYAVQKAPLGTAHAVASALPELSGFSGTILILNGDAPLLRLETLTDFLRQHRQEKAMVSLISMFLSKPTGYGRLLRDLADHEVLGVVEEKDASPEQRRIQEVNSGIYAVDAAFLAKALKKIKRHNRQKEFYLPDLIRIAYEENQKVQAYVAGDAREFLGVNSQDDLAEVERLLNHQRLERFLGEGVRMTDQASTFIGPEVKIASGVTLHPGCVILGQSQIAAGAVLGPYVYLENTTVGKAARVEPFSVLEGAKLGPHTVVGPFAHLRPGSELHEGAKVGNFVELKKTLLGAQAKANHLAYLGDTKVGPRANIGAGTITCNYDGYQKYQTEIGADAFIGSDTQLVAPVKVGAAAVIGAGTTVTQDIPAGALALSRLPQVNKKGWAKRKKRAMEKKAKQR